MQSLPNLLGLRALKLELWALLLVLFATDAAAGTERLTFRELMRTYKIQDPVISKDGSAIAYGLMPDRGDGAAVVRAVDRRAEYRVERGSKPQLSGDAQWMACAILPTQQERDEAAKKKGGKKKDGPRNGLALVSMRDGSITQFEEVESFALSEDGKWLVRKHHAAKETKQANKNETEDEGKPGSTAEQPERAAEAKSTEAEGSEESAKTEDPGEKDRPLGTRLVLRDLRNGEETTLDHVVDYALDEPSQHLAYSVAAPKGDGNGLFVLNLAAASAETTVLRRDVAGRYSQLSWAKDSSRLAFVAAIDDDLHDPGPADVWWWDGTKGTTEPKRLATSANAPEGWRIPSKNRLNWSRDGERLFFGYQWIDPLVEQRRQEAKQDKREALEKKRKAQAEKSKSSEQNRASGSAEEPSEQEEPYDPYDFEALLDGRKLDVWHHDDPLINPHQKKQWKNEKERVYLAVAHVDSGKVVRLADRELPDLRPGHHRQAALASSNLPYRKRQTWDGSYVDLYHVDLTTGARQLIVENEQSAAPRLSPNGRYVAFYRAGDWHLFDAERGSTRSLTVGLDVPFSNEDDDYPAADPGYGIADWVANDQAVLIYDKYDIWRFPTDGGRPVNLTGGQGRAEQRVFRLIDLDPDVDFVPQDGRLLLSAYHDREKGHGFWETRANRAALKRLVDAPKRFRFRAKAEEADRILYTRESYEEFPDLWVADTGLGGAKRLSDANPQLGRFARGEAELVEWTSLDGTPLQGVLIKPGNYRPGQRYPVLVYFYRFFSQRLHHFNDPVVNHRPSFPIYASDGYAVFLPDIRFEEGRPGLSAVKALVPGVQKLVEMGLADPDAIGLHGHSWSGYQTAHAVTQTNIFAAAVAGAPVSNMTSAYSGIRLGSGRARQFQYEKGQSRIGASMDADLPKYIENSPVFHARHVETPLLIQFGDADEAVPWQQGIELYLALRRLDKQVIFLQYRGEPHHLKQYGNKLDYSIKMKEFFDHHLKGAPAPDWMREGVPYRGE